MNRLLMMSLLAAAALPASAQPSTTGQSPLRVAAAPSNPAEMTEGEIRKVDKEAKKLTIKHGEIKNLDMPPMTMVFQVRDPGMIDKVKPGDKVRFRAESAAGGALVVTDLQPGK